MKKSVSILMALCLVLMMLLSACGGTAASTTESANPAASTGTENNQAAEAAPAQENTSDNNEPAAQEAPADQETVEDRGTILWLAHISSGITYDVYKAYGEAVCAKLGYKFSVVYGDPFNDAAGNLTAVTNGMTSDVVGLIASQDGGIDSIMEQYPDLYVSGFHSDMNSVFGEGGASASALSNDHFLGTICDTFADGSIMGAQYFDAVIEKGYKRISIINFPGYAYPNQVAAVETFTAKLEEYNATASDADKITLVGDPVTLEFQPLPDSYFYEDGNDNLDCIVAFCAGIQFVYPTMVTAKMNGTCRADTQIITGGFDDNADIIADIGDDKTIAWISFSPCEDIAYSVILLDDALSGNLPADFKVDRMDAEAYTIDSTEDIDNVMTKSMCGTRDVSLAQLSLDEVANACVRNNPEFTFADLQALFHSEQLTTDALKNR